MVVCSLIRMVAHYNWAFVKRLFQAIRRWKKTSLLQFQISLLKRPHIKNCKSCLINQCIGMVWGLRRFIFWISSPVLSDPRPIKVYSCHWVGVPNNILKLEWFVPCTVGYFALMHVKMYAKGKGKRKYAKYAEHATYSKLGN